MGSSDTRNERTSFNFICETTMGLSPVDFHQRAWLHVYKTYLGKMIEFTCQTWKSLELFNRISLRMVLGINPMRANEWGRATNWFAKLVIFGYRDPSTFVIGNRISRSKTRDQQFAEFTGTNNRFSSTMFILYAPLTSVIITTIYSQMKYRQKLFLLKKFYKLCGKNEVVTWPGIFF